MPYDELVKRLRSCATEDDACKYCDMLEVNFCSETLMKQAADAIEELSYKYEKALSDLVKGSKSNWIPVTERLPKNQRPVLVRVPPYTDGEEEYIEYVGMAYFTYWANGGFWCGTDGNVYGAIGFIHEPSHWMPLPSPPVEE